jgi:2-methylcitrate synthase
MDVMRTGASVLGTLEPEKEAMTVHGARHLGDRLMASFGSMLLYWYHFAHNGRRIEVETDDESLGGHFLHLLHGRTPSDSRVRAMHTSLILYAEHEFNASTFAGRVIAGTDSDIYSAIAGAIGALRGPKHGGANEAACEIQQRYVSAGTADADIRERVGRKEIIIGFGHPVYAIGRGYDDVQRGRAAGVRDVGAEKDVPQPGLVLRGLLPHDGHPHRPVHAHLRHLPHQRLGGPHHRAAAGQEDHPPQRQLHRAGEPRMGAHRPALTGMLDCEL